MASRVSTTRAAASSVMGSFVLMARGDGSALISKTCWLSMGLFMVPVREWIAAFSTQVSCTGSIWDSLGYAKIQGKVHMA